MMTFPQPPDTWAYGAAYERYVGRWSRLVAQAFLDWLAVPPGARWLDVGCGTGALSQTILHTSTPNAVMGIDPSETFITFASKQIADARAGFRVGDAQALPEATASYDVVVAGLALNFVPKPDWAVAEMVRVVRIGGTVAAYVWDYVGQMQFLRYFWDAAVALDPAISALDEGKRFSMCQPAPLMELFQHAGLRDIEIQPLVITTPFRDFDDFWTPFLGGQGPAPSYVVSLAEDQRAALRERLRTTVPIAPDGTILLNARAWAIRGER